MSAPCYQCPDRRAATATAPSCHATCEKYAAYAAEREEKHHYHPDPSKDASCDALRKRVKYRQERRRR